MPIKLQVVRAGDQTSDPADYLFEQDRITIGRGSDNDLTLPDQKISTEHAEIRTRDGQYLLYDRDSKNSTYVGQEEVGIEEPYVLESGDVIGVGEFRIEFAPLFMPSSEQTAFADEAEEEPANPFARHASKLASALEGLAETYAYVPEDQRDDELAAAIGENLDDRIDEHAVMRRLFEAAGGVTDDGAAGAGNGAASGPAARTGEPRAGSHEGRSQEARDEVLEAVLEAVAGMSRIPPQFWEEFGGRQIVDPPESARIHELDADELREHLLGADVSADERRNRLQALRDAVRTLVAHNVAMLTGYKKAIMAGSKEMLQKVNPIDAIEEAKDGGGGLSSFFGGSKDVPKELQALQERWRDLFHGEWGAVEKDLFRPTFIQTYIDRMADAWDVDRDAVAGPGAPEGDEAEKGDGPRST
jgi:pSer/pThr/pTyr-binding forkhead associated (FHA) protein